MTCLSQTLVCFFTVRLLLNFLYDLLYHSLAWSYDIVAATVSLGNWNEWVKETIPYISGTKVLELGYGPGHLQIELRKRGFCVYGLDESEQMSRQAHSRIARTGLNPDIARGVSQHLPFSCGFDAVVATFPSNFIFDTPTIDEIIRVLKPRGKLVILLTAIPGSTNIIESGKKLLAKTGFDSEIRRNETLLDTFLEHCRKKSINMKRILVDHGSVKLLILIGEKV